MDLRLTDPGVHEGLSDTLWIAVLSALEDGAGDGLQVKLKGHTVTTTTRTHVVSACVYVPGLFSGG